MAAPTNTVQIGFGISTVVMVIGRGRIGRAVIGASAEDGVAWTTITGVREIHIWRGRQDELSRIEAGGATLVLENSDGRFSPELVTGTYYPDVKPWKRVKVTRTFNSVDYPLFYGWGRWRPNLDSQRPEVVLECVDLFDRLAREEMTGPFAEQLWGARIQAVLAEMEWPSSLQDIDVGQSTLPAYAPSQVSPLQHLQDICEVEGGLVWIAGSGKVTARDRHARLTDSVSKASQATFGGASGFGFRPGEYDDGADYIRNDVRVTRTGGTTQTAVDETSKRDYGRRIDRVNSDHFLTDSQAASFAIWRRAHLKDPVARLRSINVEGGGDDSLWPKMLGLDIGHRITIVHQFPGAWGLNRDFWIEGVRHDITDGLNRHEVTYQLSAADPAGRYLVIGTGTIGNSRIGW